MVRMLSQRLSDSIDATLQAKQAHWNVKGPHFLSLHQLFDQVYNKLAEHVDLVAERIRQLGGVADGSLHTAAKQSSLPRYESSRERATDHVHAIANMLTVLGTSFRKAVDEATIPDDMATADLCTEICRDLNQLLWFVESHLHA